MFYISRYYSVEVVVRFYHCLCFSLMCILFILFWMATLHANRAHFVCIPLTTFLPSVRCFTFCSWRCILLPIREGKIKLWVSFIIFHVAYKTNLYLQKLYYVERYSCSIYLLMHGIPMVLLCFNFLHKWVKPTFFS